jgi:quercetin dioxygenase-like cupin family protein
MNGKATLTALGLLLFVTASPAWGQQGVKVTPVLKSSTTMMGQKVEYARTDRPEVMSALIEFEPGGEIGRHMHPLNGHVYVLEGAITVEMEDGSKHAYHAGKAFLEGTNTWHNARNAGAGPAKLLVVWLGEEGKPTIVRPGAGVAGPAGATPASGSTSGAPAGAQPGAGPK